MPHLAHKIYLRVNADQEQFLRRAAGVARFTYNWALAECNRIRKETGKNPSLNDLKKHWNIIKQLEFPWVYDSPKDANQDPFDNLNAAWQRFWKGGKEGKRLIWDKYQKNDALAAGVKPSQMSFAPTFKSKRDHQSFYVSNDKFAVEGQRLRLPKIGWLELKESLRFTGKIMSGVVAEDGNGWYIAVAVDAPDSEYHLPRTADGVIGVDLGIKDMAILSDGTTFVNQKPFRKNRRRLAIRQRRAARKYEAQKKRGDKQSSNNLRKAYQRVANIQARISNIRRDAQHKFTTQICRENQAVVIEKLNVAGMLKNRRLAQALSDVGLGEIKRQLEYKAHRYGVHLAEASQWFPSSKLCSNCGCKKATLKLSERRWTCEACGVTHDRDINAAINLRNLLKIPGSYREIHALPEMSLNVGSGQESKQQVHS